jgi:flagellar protein FlaG
MSNTISAHNTQVTPQPVPIPTGKVASPERAPATAKAEAAPAKSVELHPPQMPRLNIDPKTIEKNLKEAINLLNEQMKAKGRNLNFSMDQELNRTVITVKNTTSGEVVRQIPDETVLRVAHSIEKVKGLLMDQVI